MRFVLLYIVVLRCQHTFKSLDISALSISRPTASHLSPLGRFFQVSRQLLTTLNVMRLLVSFRPVLLYQY